jgi:hypothetical protein|tara:strand:- start:650 stop:949 length:300 start_codon:yes stop_codon:yes gene_type:complete
MLEVLMLIEKILNDTIGDFNCTVKVNKTNGKLPDRKIYSRSVLRQTTLDEYMDIDGTAVHKHPLNIVYTVMPNHLRKDKLYDLVDVLVNDLDKYLFTLR